LYRSTFGLNDSSLNLLRQGVFHLCILFQAGQELSHKSRFFVKRSLCSSSGSNTPAPHVHLIVPAGAFNERTRQWRQKRKKEEVLFWTPNLSRVFQAKWFEAMRLSGLHCKENLPDEWVVHCKKVGRGEQALAYLGRYLYRGVHPEKNILADSNGPVSFCYQDNKGKRQIGGCVTLVSCIQMPSA
jgi:hypothetical protein